MGKKHLRIYNELQKESWVSLIGGADIDEKITKEVGELYQVNCSRDYEELLRQSPDLVSVAVPTSLHREVAIAALQAGSHVLVEKPISNTIEDGIAIIDEAEARGLSVFVGHIERFNPAITRLKEVLDSSDLGDIVCIATLRVGSYDKRIYDTGIILDLGSHDIDLITYLHGKKVTQVFTVGSSTIHKYEDHASILLNFVSNKAGFIELSWLMPYRVRQVFAVGTEKFALANLIDQSLTLYEKTEVIGRESVNGEPLKIELESVISSIKNGTPPVVGGRESCETLSVALAAMESLRIGESVDPVVIHAS